MIAILRLLSGIVLLFFGRSLFWLYVAVIGFLAGVLLVTRNLNREPEVLVLVIALVVGILGAVLALVLPRVIGAIAGFLAGAYLAVTLLEVLDLNLGSLDWLPFLIGGIVGAVIVLVLFDWALIVLSSLAGAVTIAQVLLPRGVLAVLVTAALFVVGVVVQAAWWQRRQPTTA